MNLRRSDSCGCRVCSGSSLSVMQVEFTVIASKRSLTAAMGERLRVAYAMCCRR